MLAYAYVIVVLGDSENDVIKVVDRVIESSQIMNLIVNENKTKYLAMSRRVVNKAALKVVPYSIEQVDEFKYLGFNINLKNNMHKEI